MTGWRAWLLEIEYCPYDPRTKSESRIDAYLRSVAAHCLWDGPVLRAHKRPVDPKYWDAYKKEGDFDLRYAEMHDTFEVAGIWAVKTKEEAIRVANAYGGSVHGRIRLWGRVAQFKLGFRAEACMIDELWIKRVDLLRMVNTRNDDRLLQERLVWFVEQTTLALENRYQCKVNVV